jgi:cephalosporin hydroxylase
VEKLKKTITVPILALIVSTLVALLGVGKMIYADGQQIALKADKTEVQLKADKSRVLVLEDRMHEIDKKLDRIKTYQCLILSNMNIKTPEEC